MAPQNKSSSQVPVPRSAPGLPSSTAPRQDDDRKSGGFWALLLILAAGLLLYFAWQGPSKGSARPSAGGTHDLSSIDSMVNKHLLMTNSKIELEREKARLSNLPSIPAVGEQILNRTKPYQVRGVEVGSDRNEGNAVRDLQKPKELNLASPDTVIQSELADGETQAQRELEYKREYARQFIENARAGGYDVELDENFVVRSVKKIKPKGHGMSLFDGAGEGQGSGSQ